MSSETVDDSSAVVGGEGKTTGGNDHIDNDNDNNNNINNNNKGATNDGREEGSGGAEVSDGVHNDTAENSNDNEQQLPSPPTPSTTSAAAAAVEDSKEDAPVKQEPPRELTDAEKIELELTTSCAIMFQCAWRQRVAAKVATSLAVSIIEKIYDPRTETFYYYNKRLDKSRWDIPSYFKQVQGGMGILKVSPTYTDKQSTIMIQAASRRRLAKKTVRRLLVKCTDKVYDESTNSYYYYNRSSGETSWDKPKLWGMEDVEDYDGTRERERKRAESMSRKRSSRRGSTHGSRRPSTRGSDFSEYR